MANSLRIVAWNAFGLLPRRSELMTFVTEYDVDIILLSETHLAHYHSFSLPAYACYRQDRPLRPRCPPSGGTAVLVHRRISHRLLPPLDTSIIEGCAVAVDAGGSELRVVSAYLRPGRRTPPPPEEWDALLDHPLSTIVAGDLNAKHPSWNSRVVNAYGNSLFRFVSGDPALNVIGPEDPTYFPFHGHRPDVLDIVVVKNVARNIEVSSVSDLSSDHNPLVITVRELSASPRLPAQIVRRVNWRSYHDELSRRLPSLPADPIVTRDDLDLRATNLQELVQGVMDRHTYALEVNHRKSALPAEVLHAIWLRRQLRRRWQRTRDPVVKRRFQQQSLYVQQLLRDVNTDRWDSYPVSYTHLDVYKRQAYHSHGEGRRTARNVGGT